MAKKNPNFKPRAMLIRDCLGRGAGLREFARMIAMDEQEYLKLESRGSVPRAKRRSAYVNGLATLPDVRDPEGLFLWATTGAGSLEKLFPATALERFGPRLRELTPRDERILELPVPAQPTTRGVVQLLEDGVDRALTLLPAVGAEEARKVLEGLRGLARDAKRIGLASVAGVGLALGGADSSQASPRADQENQPFFVSRRTRGIVTKFPGAKRSAPRRSRWRGLRRAAVRTKATTRAAQTVRGTHAV